MRINKASSKIAQRIAELERQVQDLRCPLERSKTLAELLIAAGRRYQESGRDKLMRSAEEIMERGRQMRRRLREAGILC